MIIDYTIEGYKSFGNSISITMESNGYIKRNIENKFEDGLLKSSIIYGPNNTGKSALIESLELLKDLVLGKESIEDLSTNSYYYNLYNIIDKRIIKFIISFYENNNKYEYMLSIKYGLGVLHEALKVNDSLIFDTSCIDKFDDEEIVSISKIFSTYKNRLIINSLPIKYQDYTNDVSTFFKRIVVFKNDSFQEQYDNFFMKNVYSFLSNSSEKDIKLFNKLVKNADVSIEEIYIKKEKEVENKELSIISKHSNSKKNIEFYSAFMESIGSKKLMSYISQFIEGKKQGKIFLIDEIDNSLHTLLTRSLISLFNDENNTNMQLICTSHDLQLLDNEFLFRKDQIWFIYKENDDVYLYSLDDIKANDGARNKTIISYLKGLYGALPNPTLQGLLFDEK